MNPYCMWLHPVSVKKSVQKYILPKLCLTPEIKSKYFRTGECVGIGQTTVLELTEILHGLSKLAYRPISVSALPIINPIFIGFEEMSSNW